MGKHRLLDIKWLLSSMCQNWELPWTEPYKIYSKFLKVWFVTDIGDVHLKKYYFCSILKKESTEDITVDHFDLNDYCLSFFVWRKAFNNSYVNPGSSLRQMHGDDRMQDGQHRTQNLSVSQGIKNSKWLVINWKITPACQLGN